MNKNSKLRQEREMRIKERINKLNKWEAYKFLLTHLSYADDNMEKNKAILDIKIKNTNEIILKIKKLIRHLKIYVPNILEQNKMTAIYLLISKSFFDLEALLILIKHGFSFQSFDIARGAHEALDLIFLFIDESDNKNLNKWFKGEIISNNVARDSADKTMNSGIFGKIKFPVQELKRDIYDVYSEFTHSGYGAILDLVDPFHKDLDFKRLTGYHYSLKYFDNTILNLEFNILLTLKNIFIFLAEEKLIEEIDDLLIQFDKLKAKEFEINNILKNYN